MKETLLKDKISIKLKACTNCKLQCRSGGISGYGNPDSKTVLIGEAPGETEVETGIPFTGKAGQLLIQTLNLFGVSRNDVYITNIVKCHPPRNRQPEAIEIGSCIKYLYDELYIIKPSTIVLLGSIALFGILNKQTITSYRGQWTMWYDLKVMPTFHPSYCLEGRDNYKNHYELFIQDLAKVFTNK